ncbi:hypothetical protein ABZW47_24040 [Streptomyces sp. NPDC004549]|uniref:hypothetical protein n=1 Tax=unclassified Streptomyces TaxID=2593676 RepID=UPI0018F5CADB|nr:hypothetical protein [Streptomyces sp. DSM 110735]MBJ7907412.1 hypothetical protein [Streptomyces sp. DSM 110735]
MSSVLVIGYDPQAIPGVDAPALRTALEKEMSRFAEHGIDAAMTLVVFDETAEETLTTSLDARPWDVVVVGGGIRKTEALLPLFERIVNLIRRHAPQAAIAFNAHGGDSVDAALRLL